jgi:hypothetical protein
MNDHRLLALRLGSSSMGCSRYFLPLPPLFRFTVSWPILRPFTSAFRSRRTFFVNTTPDGTRIGWLFAPPSTTRRDVTHEFTERRPFGDEVDFTNRRLNDRFDALQNEARAHWPSCLSRQKHRHSPIFAEAPE